MDNKLVVSFDGTVNDLVKHVSSFTSEPIEIFGAYFHDSRVLSRITGQ